MFFFCSSLVGWYVIRWFIVLVVIIGFVLLVEVVWVKDLVVFNGVRMNVLMGYGLVVGLEWIGDME